MTNKDSISKIQKIPLAKLKVDDELYPRQNINERHVTELARAYEASVSVAALVVGTIGKDKQLIIADGVHRFNALSQLGHNEADCIIKQYANRAEFFKDAIMLNSAHGLKLDNYDRWRAIEIGEKLGLKEVELASILRTSISHLRQLKPRFATVADATAGVSELRRIALKASTRHLSGKEVTEEQATAIAGGPGQSFLLTIRQLCDALEFDLLPPQEDHRILWDELSRLAGLLDKTLTAAKTPA